MKKVLMISFCFPPYAESGVYRVLRFAKFLPQYEWQPVILTVRDKYYTFYKTDSTLLSQVEKQKVYKTKMFRHYSHIDIPFWDKIKGFLQPEGTDSISSSSSIEKSSKEKKQGIVDRIKDITAPIPDEVIGWLPFAVLSGIKIVRKEKIDAIYTTGSPWTTHLIGYLLKCLTNKPWVAEFRDPWTQDPWKKDSKKLRDKLSRLLENKVVKKADHIITTTRALTEDFISRFSQIQETNFSTIENGFDPDDFRELTQSHNKELDVFTITHTGYLYRQRSPEIFLRALSQVISDKLIPREAIRVNFVGQIDESFQIDSILEGLGISDLVELIGHIPHQKSIQYLIDSDILLLIQPSTTTQIPAKVYEYIAVNKPILCLSPIGATSGLILKEDIGVVVHSDDIQVIAQAIYELYLRFKQNNLEIKSCLKLQERYNGSKLTCELDKVLNKIKGQR